MPSRIKWRAQPGWAPPGNPRTSTVHVARFGHAATATGRPGACVAQIQEIPRGTFRWSVGVTAGRNLTNPVGGGMGRGGVAASAAEAKAAAESVLRSECAGGDSGWRPDDLHRRLAAQLKKMQARDRLLWGIRTHRRNSRGRED